MNIELARSLLIQALGELTEDIPAPPVDPILTTPAEFDAAYAAATSGSTIKLAPEFVYLTPFTFSKAGVSVFSAVPEGRMAVDVPLPRFNDGLTVTGDNVILRGLEVRKNNHLTDIVTVLSANVVLDRLRILGDPTAGAKRGIAAHANGNLSILRCYVADCFGTYPGNDTQAILAWDMLPGLLIEDNFLEGGSETIMVGGADSTSPARDPKDITIRGNTITKKALWQTQLVGVKNTLELKNARNVLIENNDISLSWGGHGQDGYLLALTVRNQSGTNPTSTIQDVLVQNNNFSSGSAAINILGSDNNAVAIKMARVQIVSNHFTNLNPATYTGAVKAILLGGGSEAVEIRDNTFVNTAQFSSAIYFYGAVPANIHNGLVITGNVLPRSNYGIFGEGSSTMNPTATPGAAGAITRYVTNGVYNTNTVSPV